MKYRKIISPRAARQSDVTNSLKAKGLGEAVGLVKRFLRNCREALPLGCGQTIHAKLVELIRGLARQRMLQGCAAGVGVIQIQKLDLIGGQRNENLQRICRARHRRLAQMRERFGQIFAVH